MSRFAASAIAVPVMLLAVVLDQLAAQGTAFGSTSRFVYVLGAAVVGALILRRHPRHAIGWTFALIALAASLNSAASDYARLRDPNGVDALALWLGWFGSWSWFAEIGMLVIALPLLFPTGRALSRRWSLIGWLGVVAVVLLCFHAAIAPGPLEMLPAVENPFGVREPWVVLLADVGFLAFFLAIGGAIVSSIVRFRRAGQVERQQMKWLISALVMFAAAFTVAAFAYQPGEHGPGERNILAETAIVATGTLVPIAAGLAILRYRLYDIDVLINRALVYGVVSAALLTLYLGAVLILQATLRPLTSGSELAVAGSTLLVVAFFQPLRRRVQAAVDRRFYRSRYDAGRTLDAFSARLREDVDLDSVRADLVAVLDATVRPAHASVWLRTPGR